MTLGLLIEKTFYTGYREDAWDDLLDKELRPLTLDGEEVEFIENRLEAIVFSLDSDSICRGSAVWALGKSRSKAVASILLKFLSSDIMDSKIGCQLAIALGNIFDSNMINLDDQERRAMRHNIRRLGLLGDRIGEVTARIIP